MSSAWGLSWLKAWGNSWGMLTPVPPEPPEEGNGGGGGAGWVLQQFTKRPWEHEEEIKAIYRQLVQADVPTVAKVVAPYKEAARINWTALLQDIEVVRKLIRLKVQQDEDEEEEALILLLSY